VVEHLGTDWSLLAQHNPVKPTRRHRYTFKHFFPVHFVTLAATLLVAMQLKLKTVGTRIGGPFVSPRQAAMEFK
jgi:hypothetical protein